MRSDTPHPNFFIVGVAKGGTTSLHAYLSQHPQVYMSPIKETNYFSQADMHPDLFNREYRDDISLDLVRYLSGSMTQHVHIANIEHWDDYIQLFRDAEGRKAVGEASTSYLFCPSTAARLAETFPDARIVMILRNPIDRAYSHYLMNLRLGKTLDTDFIHEIEADYQRSTKGWGVSRLYLELGLYAEQVRRYLEHFPKQQVHIILYDDYRENARETMQSLCRFLDIDDHAPIDLSRKLNSAGMPRFRHINYALTQIGAVSAIKRLISQPMKQRLQSLMYSRANIPKMDSRARSRLADFYRDDVGQLGELLSRDLSGWLRH